MLAISTTLPACRGARLCARPLIVLATRHASVLTPMPTTPASSTNSSTSLHKATLASRSVGLVQPLGAAAAAQRTMSAWPAEAQPAELRYILAASRNAIEGTNSMSPSARRARAARATRMLSELETTLAASRQVLTRLEGREQRFASPATTAPQPAAASTVAASSSSCLGSAVAATACAVPHFASDGGYGGNDGHGNAGGHDAYPTAGAADHRDHLITAALFAMSGLIGYTSYQQRDEAMEVFADGRYPQQERLPLLCSLER